MNLKSKLSNEVVYQEANELIRYTFAERFKHLTFFATANSGLIAISFVKDKVELYIYVIALLGIMISLSLLIMQWRAVWRMHELMKIIQNMENDDGFWIALLSSKRPIWLNRFGDTETTLLLFLSAIFGWLNILIYKLICMTSLDVECLNLIMAVILSFIISVLVKRSFILPARKKGSILYNE